MKNITLLFSGLFFIRLLLATNPLSGQVCVPLNNGSAQGIFPETLPDVCMGTFYEETVSIRVPLDTLVSVGGSTVVARIDSFTLDNIVGLPLGLTYTCLTPFCQTMGGNTSCLLIQGTPSHSGNFPLDIYVTYHAKIAGNPVSRSDTLLGYYNIQVNDLVSTAIVIDARCGSVNGSVSISLSGTAPYTYLWSTGETTSMLDNIPPGQYVVEASDANACMTTDTLSVNNVGENPQIIPSKVTWEGCLEDGGGVIDLSIQGGKPGYVYSWSHGSTSQDLTQLPAGQYSLTVSDADNCVSTEHFVITPPIALNLGTLIQTNVLCAGDNSGSVSTLISGGLAPYDIHWNTNPPVFSTLLNNLEAGIYTLSVSDSLACQKNLDITITEPPALASEIIVDGETYAGAKDGSATVTTRGGSPPYTYLWSTSGISPQLDSLENGTYVLTTTDANGCMLVDSVFVGKWATGIEDELEAGFSSLQFLPNPSAGIFSIEAELSHKSAIEIQVLDLSGKAVSVDQFKAVHQFHYTLDLSRQGAGLYLIRLQTSKGTVFKKLWIL